MKIGLFLALTLTAGQGLAETAAGVTYLADASHEERPLALSIWYPTDEKASVTIGGNPVFEGVATSPDAGLPEDRLPLVVVSHGGLRSTADSGAWLSSAIARAGFIVVEINAPRPDNAAMGVDEIWRRPQDISRAIDLMLADGNWGKRIEEDRISVAGFALGATAALAVAGAELDVESYMQSCAADGAFDGPDCGWFAAQGVEPSQASREGLALPVRDPRVTAVIAVNPEYPASLDVAPAAGMAMLLVTLGRPIDTPEAVQANEIISFPSASVFDAFAACTEAGPSILLEEEGDASICGDSKEARETIHLEVSEAITSFLVKNGE